LNWHSDACVKRRAQSKSAVTYSLSAVVLSRRGLPSPVAVEVLPIVLKTIPTLALRILGGGRLLDGVGLSCRQLAKPIGSDGRGSAGRADQYCPTHDREPEI
jgi:hypothetical protein